MWASGMEREVLVRRVMHCLIALAPIYFLIPDDLPVINVRRWVLLIIFFAAVSIVDAWRRWKKIPIFGLRPHEKDRIASFAWAAAGITLVLWLVPKDLATATLIGMALTDPFSGELRRTYGKTVTVVAISLAVYFLLAFSTLAIWGDHGIVACVMIAGVGACIAIPSEFWKSDVVDDDFLMLALPGTAMSLIALYV